MDWLYVLMPISGCTVFWPGLIILGLGVGIIGGFFGMGGAWMVTPGLNILGFPMAFAIGTDVAHMAGKSLISTMRHGRFGNVDYKLGLTMLVGTVVGVEIGAQIVMQLERLGSKLHAIKIPPMVHFHQAGIYCSAWLPICVSFLTGVLAGILGIGGGLIRMPALVYLVGCPTHIAVGTDLFEVAISGLYGAATYTLKGRTELVAALIMLIGAAVGAQIGAVATKYIKGYGIRTAFGLAVLGCLCSVVLKLIQPYFPAYAGFINGVSTVVVLGFVSGISIYIAAKMVQGAKQELAEKRRAAQN